MAVTGSAGGVGRVLCPALADAGFDVLGLDLSLSTTLRDDGRTEQRVIDLLDRVAVFDALAGIDAVVHMANHPNSYAARPPTRVYTDNVTTNTNVFEAALAHGCNKLVFFSSIQAQGSTRMIGDDPLGPSHIPYLPMDGNTPAYPTNYYGLSKVVGEQLLEMHCRLNPELAGVVVRLPYIGGEPGRPMERKLDEVRRRGWQKFFSADEGFAYIPPADVASLVLALLRGMTPGFDRVLAAVNDNQFSLPAERVAADYFAGVEVRQDLSGRFTLIDNAPITRRYGWEPTPVQRPAPVPG